MKHICIIAGTRPNLIKVPPLVAAAKEHGIVVDLVDTYQHYDKNMRDVFYAELQLPQPKEDLSGDTDCIMVIGDTNSTLAGAMIACERGIPLAHVEAGCRCWNKQLPEEVNRIMVDALSDHLFCPTETAARNVRGIFTGDVLYDMFKRHRPQTDYSRTHVLFTMHRAGNTKDEMPLQRALEHASGIGRVVFPIHPRTRGLLGKVKLPKNVEIFDPVGYEEMLRLIARSIVVFTDSGGVQREAYWMGVPFELTRDETSWPETLFPGNNDKFGDGHAAEKIMEILADA